MKKSPIDYLYGGLLISAAPLQGAPLIAVIALSVAIAFVVGLLIREIVLRVKNSKDETYDDVYIEYKGASLGVPMYGGSYIEEEYCVETILSEDDENVEKPKMANSLYVEQLLTLQETIPSQDAVLITHQDNELENQDNEPEIVAEAIKTENQTEKDAKKAEKQEAKKVKKAEKQRKKLMSKLAKTSKCFRYLHVVADDDIYDVAEVAINNVANEEVNEQIKTDILKEIACEKVDEQKLDKQIPSEILDDLEQNLEVISVTADDIEDIAVTTSIENTPDKKTDKQIVKEAKKAEKQRKKLMSKLAKTSKCFRYLHVVADDDIYDVAEVAINNVANEEVNEQIKTDILKEIACEKVDEQKLDEQMPSEILVDLEQNLEVISVTADDIDNATVDEVAEASTVENIPDEKADKQLAKEAKKVGKQKQKRLGQNEKARQRYIFVPAVFEDSLSDSMLEDMDEKITDDIFEEPVAIKQIVVDEQYEEIFEVVPEEVTDKPVKIKPLLTFEKTEDVYKNVLIELVAEETAEPDRKSVV